MTRCPWCGVAHDSIAGVGGERGKRPDAGSVTLCVSCGRWCVFEDDFIGLRLRKPTDEELAKMREDETIRAVEETFAQHFPERVQR